MDQSAYITYCHSELKKVFTAIQNGKPDISLKHRTEGLIRAGEVLALFNRKEAKELVERAHYEVFGESIAGRGARKKSLSELKALSPDEYFEIPAIERRN
ncbi:hypothetical protein KJ365_13415 [Glaciecola sp. XM2]|uniref:hypothetical protein n=1 Tax=Glaciecola sp. XM2 TaxID=1914931 RepID=UPI001BDDEC5B|nr:hypothetical protein [Glaciecola sp. XM2]MBT1451886.1 hypothetical protein [Glaciecola sp. XM2]